MTHDISVSSGRAHMAYTGMVPWHRLGVKVAENATPSEAAAAAGLDWRAFCAPTMINNPDEDCVSTNVVSLIREDVWDEGRHNEAIIGTVSKDYIPVQNSDLINVLDTMTRESEARFETAGTLGKGEKSWFMVKLSDGVEVAKNDPVEMYLVLVNRFDLQCVEARLTPVRVVCSNTLSLSMLWGATAEIPHEMVSQERMLKVAIDLNRIRSASRDLYALFEKMANTSINAEQLNAMADATFPTSSPGENKSDLDFEASHARTQSKVYSKSGVGNTAQEVAGTVWTALNGITEYLDHYQNPRLALDKQLESIWFGDGYYAKLRAVEYAKMLVDDASGTSSCDTVGVCECSSDQERHLALV